MATAFADLYSLSPRTRRLSSQTANPSEVVTLGNYQVSKEAADAFEYPLVGIGHTQVLIPKRHYLEGLTELLLEQCYSRGSWDRAMAHTKRFHRSLFDEYTLVYLPQRSNAIPEGEFVFKIERRVKEVAWSDVYQLSTLQRSQVLDAVELGLEEFPLAHHVHCLLRPVFAERNFYAPKTNVLLHPREFLQFARTEQASLHKACRIRKWKKWWQGSQRPIPGALLRQLDGRMLNKTAQARGVQFAQWQKKISASQAQLLVAKYDLAHQYEQVSLDPLWAVSEPAWRIPKLHQVPVEQHRSGFLEFFRRIVHWVDSDHSIVTLPSPVARGSLFTAGS